MQPYNFKKYKAADIAKYHSGGMSSAEMHRLEKAALDDPFLADALDGFAYTKTGSQDVKVLRRRLQKRVQRVHVLYSRKQLFVSVAALFILVAGFGWLATKLVNKDAS